MTFRVQASFAAFVALLAVATVSPHAGAQAAAKAAAAQALFDEAKALMGAGRAVEACPKFEESQKLDPGSGTLINLALCYETTGRTASAWTTYRDAAAAANVAGNTKRERGARERANALAPKVSKLQVDVPHEARLPGLAVTRDGIEVGAAQWGAPIPTDEGVHEVVATAPGYVEWRSKVELASGGASVSVQVPKLVAASGSEIPPVAAVGTEPPPKAPAAEASQTGPNASERKSGLGAQRIAAIAVGGVGVAGLVVGTVFGVKALSKKDEADETCDGNACRSEAGVTAGNDAQTAGNVSTVAMIVGAAFVAGGAVLWLTAPQGKTEVGLGPSGVVLRGKF